MKRVLAVLLCLLLVMGSIFTMIACGGDETADPNGEGGDGTNNGHVHTYKTDAEWSFDATGHWYDATCTCADATVRKLNHVDDNKDGACDVCKFSDHEHFYAEEWTADCTNHWNAAACGCIIAGDNVAAHADENGDGECDTCKYVIEDLHNHYYDTAWTSDGSYHWHAALCEHGAEVADKAVHEINAAGDCSVCNAHIRDVDMNDIGAVLAAAQANDYKVAFGDVIAKDSVYGGTGAQTLENGKTNRVHFALGNGESYIQYITFDMYGNYVGQEEQWHEQLGEDKYFAAAMLHGEYELSPIMGGAQFMNGYNYIPGSIIPSDSADTSTLSNMLAALYAQMKAGIRVSNATESVENGVYKFSYTYYSVNTTTVGGELYTVELELYNVDVEFVMNEDMIISMADFTVEVYRDYENDSDLDYAFDDLGGGEINITSGPTLKATANPSYYEYSVYQLSGERTFTNPYPKASLLPASFEFYHVISTGWNDDYTAEVVTESERIGDYYEIEQDVYAKFAIGEILPETASTKFMDSSDFRFTFENTDPNSEGRAWYMDPGSVDETINGYNAYSGMLKLKLRDPGVYTVTLGFGDVVKVFTLKITGPEIDEIPETNATQVGVLVTDNNTYYDVYSYTADADGSYTFSVPAGLGFASKTKFDNGSNPEVDYMSNQNGQNVTVKLDAGEVFEFYVAADTKNTVWTIPVSFVAGEGSGNTSGGDVGGDDEGGDTPIGPVDISGTYTGNGITLVINSDGTMVMTRNGIISNYTYENRDGTYYYSLNGNAEYAGGVGMAQYFGYLVFGADGMPTDFVYSGSTIALTRTGDAGEGGGDVGGGDEGGEEETIDITGTYNFSNGLVVTIDAENVTFAQGNNSATYTYDISNGAVVIYNSYTGQPWSSSMIAIELTNGAVSGAVYNGNSFTLVSVGGGDEEEESVELVMGENNVTVTGDNNAMTTVTFTATEAGDYIITVGSNAVVVEGYTTYLPNDEIWVTLAAGESVTYEVNSYDFSEGTVTITVALNNQGGEDEGDDNEGGESDDSLQALVQGTYHMNGYTMGLYQDYDTGNYLANIYDDAWTVDLYFTYTVTDNGDGTYTLTLTYTPAEWEMGVDQKDAILAMDWTVELDPVKQAVIGYYEFPEYSLSISRDEMTGEYIATVADNSWSVFLYFTYTVTDNGDGTKTINLTYVQNDEEVGVESLDAILAYDFTIGEVEGGEDEGGDEPSDMTDIATLEGSGAKADPYVIVDAGQYFMANVNSYPGQFITFTAPYDMTITLIADVSEIWSISFSSKLAEEDTPYVVTLAAGDTLNVTICRDTGTSDVILTVSFEGGEEGGDEPVVPDEPVGPTEPNGSEENPYIVTDGFSMSFSADYFNPVFVQVNAGVTATINGSAAFYASAYSFAPIGTSVTPDVDTVYVIYADTSAGATYELTGTVGSSDTELEGSGTAEDAYSASASNTASVPAGNIYVYYTFTAVADGTVTITFTGDNFAWIYGSSAATMTDMHSAATATVEMLTGDVIYIAVTTVDGEAGTVAFTIDAPQPAPSFDYNTTIVEGENTLYFSADEIAANTATRPLVITTAGNYKFAAGALFISSVTDADGNAIARNADYTYTLVAGEYTVTFGMLSMFGVQADTAQTLNVTAQAPVEPEQPEEPVEPEEPATPDGTQENPYVIPALPYEHELTGMFDFYMTYTVTENGTLTIQYPSGTSIDSLPGNFVKDYTAKTWTGTVTAGQIIKMNVYTYYGSEGVLSFTLTVDEPEEPESDNPVLEGSGSQSDPWIIASTPFSYTLTGAHDKYFEFTATEKCTVTVIVPAGCAAFGLPGSSTYDANDNKVYSFVLNAGDSITLNAYRTSGSADYTYTMTTEAIVEPEPTPDPEPGEGGGEVAGDPVTYLAVHSGGRKLKVEINPAAGTMTLTRSDMTGNFGTGGQSIAEYTYSYNGSTVTVTNISGQVCTCVFGADGAPTSITWGSQVYTDFVVQ